MKRVLAGVLSGVAIGWALSTTPTNATSLNAGKVKANVIVMAVCEHEDDIYARPGSCQILAIEPNPRYVKP